MKATLLSAAALAASILASIAGEPTPIPELTDYALWSFTDGPEFPGAVGSFELAEDGDATVAAINYDFTGGGSYVSAGLKREVGDFDTLAVKVKDEQAGPVILRIIDSSDECFQFKGNYTNPGEWQELRFDIKKPNVECWGGDANKTVDFPVKKFWFGSTKARGEPKGKLLLKDLTLERY